MVDDNARVLAVLLKQRNTETVAHPAQSDSDGRSQKKTGWSRSHSVAGRGTANGWRPSYVCEE